MFNFTKQSKLSGILDVFIITFVVFVLKNLFDQSLMTTSISTVYLQEHRL